MSIRPNRDSPGRARALDAFHDRLARGGARPLLLLLAVATGAATSLIVGAFFAAIEFATDIAGRVAGGGGTDPAPLARAALAVAGALLIGVLLTPLAARQRRAGVSHVLEHLVQGQARLPLANAAVQYCAGSAALGAGLSGGAEGPAVHLGAAGASALARGLRIPQNSARVLLACGAAAALSCSFDAPLAGVVFALEVVLMEYAVATFIPVLIAAVTAKVVGQWTFGHVEIFAVDDVAMHTPWELPIVALAGCAIGALAAAFVAALRGFANLGRRPFWLRAGLAGVITGAAALATPAILGVGYETVDATLLGQLAWPALLVILVGKLVASSACVGLGLPVGVIAPTLVMGAVGGELLGQAAGAWAPFDVSPSAFYALLGMGAMLAAALHAPLTGLLVVLELTGNMQVILAAMLIVALATATARQAFRQPWAFIAALGPDRFAFPSTPAEQHLLRIAVAGVMERRITTPGSATAEGSGGTAPRWRVAADASGGVRVGAVDGAAPHHEASLAPSAFIDSGATLLEARARLNSAGVETLCARREGRAGHDAIVGVLSRADIDAYLTGH